MRYTLSTALLLFAVSFSAAPPVAQAADSVAAVVYKPPLRGAPASRIGGGTRGTGEGDFVLNVLAPDHTGRTSMAQPTLYWYASGPATASVEVVVIGEVAEKPLLSKNIRITSGGVQSFDLSRNGVSLKPDTEYEWFVSVVPDSTQRSKDVTSGGTIRRVALDPAVQARAATAGERQAPGVYAEAGFWYDAIDSLSRLIERYPGDAGLRVQRAALLEQVGLPAAAAHDKAGAR